MLYEGQVENVGEIACRMPNVVAVAMKGGKVFELFELPLDEELLEPGKSVAFHREVSVVPGIEAMPFALDCPPLTFERG